MITTIYKAGYVLNKVDGHVTIQALLEYAQCNVDTGLQEPVLWDLTNGTLKEDKSDYQAIRNIVRNTHTLARKRKGRKTAFVALDQCTYGMLRMAIGIVEVNESRIIASVFSDMGEAKAWLKET